MTSILPPEIEFHRSRLSPETLVWLKSEIQPNLPLESFAQSLLDLITKLTFEHGLPVDSEVVYLAFKTGVFTGKLQQVLSFNWEKMHPAIRAYQGMALLLMNNFSKAEQYLNKARKDAELSQDIAVLGEVFGLQIFLANAQYKFIQGVHLLQESLSLVLSPKNKDYFSFFQWIRVSGAKSLLKLGNVQEAIHINKRAIIIAEKLNDSFFHSFGLLGLGHCFDMISKTPEAIKNYQKAINLAKDIKAQSLMSIIYNRLGMVWAWKQDNLKRGEGYFTEAVNQADNSESFWLREGPQWNLMALYRKQKSYFKAIQSIENIIKSAQKVGESRTELIAYLNLIELLEAKGELGKAELVRETVESLASILDIDLHSYYDDNNIDDFGDNVENEADSDGYDIKNYLEEYEDMLKDDDEDNEDNENES